MKTLTTLFYILFLMSFSSFAHDAETQNAINITQDMLRDPVKRKKAIKGTAAEKADQQVKALGGSPKATEDIYGLAADIMGNLAKGQKGDPGKMEEVLKKAMQDPEGFANTFTPEQRTKLRQIADEIEKKKQTP